MHAVEGIDTPSVPTEVLDNPGGYRSDQKDILN